MGVQAIFGPSDPFLGTYIYSICDALDIPYLDTRIDAYSGRRATGALRLSQSGSERDRAETPFDLDTNSREFAINLNPTQSTVNTAIQDVMRFLNWTKLAIVYECSHGSYAKCVVIGNKSGSMNFA